LQAIEASVEELSKAQKKIAEYILANYEKAAFMTAIRLARFAEVSESTVVRFAMELGYDGYPEMRRALQDSMRSKLTSVQRIKVANDRLSSHDILTQVLSSDIEQIRQTMENTDSEVFAKAVCYCRGKKHLYPRSSFFFISCKIHGILF